MLWLSRNLFVLLSIVWISTVPWIGDVSAGESGQPKADLPPALARSIAENYPLLHFPTTVDLKGSWAGQVSPGHMPYLTWGDFNGDSHLDAALLLLDQREWKFVIFHGDGEAYSLAFSFGGDIGNREALIEKPQDVTLETIGEGRDIVIEAGGKALRYNFPLASIRFTVAERAVSIFYWKNGAYESLDFMD